MPDCAFCKIVRKEIPAYIIYEDKNTLAFLDIYPIKKGQTVVIPKKHTTSNFSQADINLLHDTLDAAHTTAGILESKLKALRSFVIIQGYGIDHFHIKLYPSFPGESEEFTITMPSEMEKQEVLSALYKQLTT